MGSATVIINEHDNPFVPSMKGIYGGMVHPAKKGKVGTPVLTTSESNLISVRGYPDPKMGSFMYDGFAFLSNSDKMWSQRATHTNSEIKTDGTLVREDASLPSTLRYKGEARYSAALVRAIIADVDTTSPLAVYSDESMVVKPFGLGLVQDEVDSFIFPEYIGTREYATVPLAGTIKHINSGKAYLTTTVGLAENDKFGISPDFASLNSALLGTNGLYTISKIGIDKNQYHVLTVDAPITLVAGISIINSVTGLPYDRNPYVTQPASGSNQIFVSNSDMITDGDTITFGASGVNCTVLSKGIVTIDEQFVQTVPAIPNTVNSAWSLFKVTHYEIEQRDALLILADSQGLWGDKTSLGIEKSNIHVNAFDIVIYENGAEVERWKDCSRDMRKDGFGHQMFVEDRVNGNSGYIMVVNNTILDDTIPPLESKYSFWRENSVDIFEASTISTVETINSGDMYINTGGGVLPIGSRIKFGTYTDEYKVADVVNGQMVLDRPFIPNKVSVGTPINLYARTESKPITRLDGSKAGVILGATYVVGNKIGKILDAGANYLSGGDDGYAVTVYDLMMGADVFANKGKYPLTLLMDGGFAHPALAQKLVSIAESRDTCYAYLSNDPANEDSRNYINGAIEYRNSLNLNTSHGSLFHGWVEVADPYSQQKVWISPVGFAMACQSYVAGNSDMWTPAAGWNNGGLKALRVKRNLDKPERDILVDNQINPIRYEDGAGLAIWGNETLLTLPSVLQSRHVRMLLIVIKEGLNKYLDAKLFDLNTERGRTMIEAAINAYMRDEIGNGVYAYTVSVNEYTSDTDIANKKVKIFLGLQPTEYIKEFQVDMALFSANQKIQIA